MIAERTNDFLQENPVEIRLKHLSVFQLNNTKLQTTKERAKVMGFFNSMLSDIASLVKGAGDGSAKKADIESRLTAFKSLRSSLDFQWRKLEADWKKASSVEANLKKTPLMRAQTVRRAKSIAQRMAMIGKFCNMVETFTSVLEQSQALREHAEQMKSGMGDAAQFKALGDEMNALMAQNKEVLDGISKIQMQFDDFHANMDMTLAEEGDKEELSRLNELYEKLETCQVKGDTAGAKAVQEQIAAIVSGGSTLAIA